MSCQYGVTATVRVALSWTYSGYMASRIVRAARRVRNAIVAFHHANQRANALLLSYGLVETDRAPDTYAEFLLRARAAHVHEPAARHR
jgi:hypothetical protein